MSRQLYEDGMKARRKVLGDAVCRPRHRGRRRVQRRVPADGHRVLLGHRLGTRTTLDDRQRSLINLGVIAALNRGDEFKTHVRGALRNACTLDEIRDSLLQVAVYCGIPAGVEAFRLARQVFEADGVTPDRRPAPWHRRLSLGQTVSSVDG